MNRIILKVFTVVSIVCLVSISAYAVEGNYTTFGNTVMDSVDKTKESLNNVMESNIVKDEKKMITDTKDAVERTVEDTTTPLYGDNYKSDYNTVQTTTEVENTGVYNMSTTTWMWIILISAAVIIMAAIWYYAVQGN